MAKASVPKKEPTIKYADKSAGQPELIIVFEEIKKRMLPYENKRSLKVLAQTYGQFHLISFKPVVIDGRERNEFWFVSAMIQKGYVGFYWKPVYAPEEMKKNFSPGFVKCLKGKGCFYIRNTDPLIMKDIEKAIKVSYAEYIKRGWL